MVLQEAEQLSAQHACMILCLPAIGQEHVLLAQPTGEDVCSVYSLQNGARLQWSPLSP